MPVDWNKYWARCDELKAAKDENAKLREALQAVIERYERVGNRVASPDFGVSSGIYAICKNALTYSESVKK